MVPQQEWQGSLKSSFETSCTPPIEPAEHTSPSCLSHHCQGTGPCHSLPSATASKPSPASILSLQDLFLLLTSSHLLGKRGKPKSIYIKYTTRKHKIKQVFKFIFLTVSWIQRLWEHRVHAPRMNMSLLIWHWLTEMDSKRDQKNPPGIFVNTWGFMKKIKLK